MLQGKTVKQDAKDAAAVAAAQARPDKSAGGAKSASSQGGAASSSNGGTGGDEGQGTPTGPVYRDPDIRLTEEHRECDDGWMMEEWSL